MKITIDTVLKTISVETQIEMGHLVSEIEAILPDWKSYKLTQKEEPLIYHPNVPFYTPSTDPFYVENPCLTGITQGVNFETTNVTTADVPYTDNWGVLHTT